MVCMKCGAELEEGAKICQVCGEPVKEQAEPSVGETAAAESESEERQMPEEEAETPEKELTEELAERSEEPAEEEIKPEAEEAGYSREKTEAENEAEAEEALSRERELSQIQRENQQRENAQRASSSWGDSDKKSKAPYVVMGVIGLAMLAALVYVVCSLLGVGDPRTRVGKAVMNTLQEVAEQNEYAKGLELLLKNEAVAEKLELTLSELTVTEYEETRDLLMNYQPVRFLLEGVTDRADQSMMAELSGGIGDMKDIRLKLFLDEQGYQIYLPDLYEEYLLATVEDMEELAGVKVDFSETADRERTQKAVASLGRTLEKWAVSAYNDVTCEKVQADAALTAGNRSIQADEYALEISRRNYEKHMKKLPDLIAGDETFMTWLTGMTSEEESEEFLESVQQFAEDMMFDATISEVILCNVWVADNKAVQISFPMDSEDGELTGELVISFFGEKNLGDEIIVLMDAVNEGERLFMEYTQRKAGAESEISFRAELLDWLSVDMRVTGSYEAAKDSCTYRVKQAELSAEVTEYEGMPVSSFYLALEGSYVVEKAEGITVPDASAARSIADMSDQEAQELLFTVLENMQQKGYVPSSMAGQLEGLIGILINSGQGANPGDNGGGALDGSGNMTFEEFSESVRALYGGLYTEEELRTLYDSIYGGNFSGEDFGSESGYDTSGVVYGSSGLPLLFCDSEDLILELQPVEGFEFSPEYSDAFTVEYEKYIGDTDLIVMDYFIIAEDVEEYLELGAEYQSEYYSEESGYSDLTIGELQHGMINGRQASWIEYTAKNSYGNLVRGYIAAANIDGEHSCVMDLYSLYGTEEVNLDLLYQCFDMYLIEQ